jgi:hypothetical protein
MYKTVGIVENWPTVASKLNSVSKIWQNIPLEQKVSTYVKWFCWILSKSIGPNEQDLTDRNAMNSLV